MLQHRKKDYLIRLIEDLMRGIQRMVDKDIPLTESDKASLLNDAFEFFETNFNVTDQNTSDELMEKIPDIELLQQYARLLSLQSEISGVTDKAELQKGLDIVEYIQAMDKTYSWERIVLREDILRQLDSQS